MFFEEDNSHFQYFPPEMIVEVLSHVDLEGKRKSRLVCRLWCWILNHPGAGLVCFRENFVEMTENSIQCLLESQLLFDHLEFRDVKVTWPSMTYSRNKFPQIRELILESGNSDQTLMAILQYGCAQTESLSLGEQCFSVVRLDLLSRVLSGMRWNYLTELNVQVVSVVNGLEYSRENKNMKGVELIFKKAIIPNLKVLGLYLFSEGEGERELPVGLATLMSNLMIFLEHHSKTLKKLQLDLYLTSTREEILILPNISATLFSAEQQSSIARDLKLQCLEIATTHFDALLQLVPPCVWASNNLNELKWCPLEDHSLYYFNRITTPKPKLIAPPGTDNPLQSLIQRNRSTLTKATTTFICGDIDVDPVQMSWLESCPQLTELTITNFDKFLSIKLNLPTVKKLNIELIINLKSIEDMSTWISRTFRNLESVQFSVIFTVVLQNGEFDWIQNLLLLPRLAEIRFGFTHWYRYYEESQYPFTGPNLIHQYCSNRARLMFMGRRQGGLEDLLSPRPCVIKILPIQIYN